MVPFETESPAFRVSTNRRGRVMGDRSVRGTMIRGGRAVRFPSRYLSTPKLVGEIDIIDGDASVSSRQYVSECHVTCSFRPWDVRSAPVPGDIRQFRRGSVGDAFWSHVLVKYEDALAIVSGAICTLGVGGSTLRLECKQISHGAKIESASGLVLIQTCR